MSGSSPSIRRPSRLAAAAGIAGVLCVGFAAHARDGGDFPASDPEAISEAPQVAPCSTRLPLRADIDPGPPASGKAAKKAMRKTFETRRHWSVKENLSILSAEDAGLEEPALRVRYPKGTSAPSDKEHGRGGAGFYAPMALEDGAEIACLYYKVRFPEGFDFVKGGKLPGLYGGKAPSGGKRVTGRNGFSMRFMWREDGQGELYEYIANKDADMGLSVGRGLWTFPTGRWVTVEQELVLNDPDAADGIARVWIDGAPVLEQTDIVYRTRNSVTIDGLMFSTFFGGKGEGWRTPRDQTVDFADFRLYAPDRRSGS